MSMAPTPEQRIESLRRQVDSLHGELARVQRITSHCRASDPTLEGMDGWVDVQVSVNPPVAHLYAVKCKDWKDNSTTEYPTRYACWFAVPCHTCFPSAPPPGTRPIFVVESDDFTVREIENLGLSWQVPQEELT